MTLQINGANSRLSISLETLRNFLMISPKLQSIKMKEEKLIEDYLNNLKNQLSRMGEDVLDTTLVQMVLNGLPRRFDAMISSISNMDALSTFDGVSAKLISAAHLMQQ
jgi:hypothetical protein